MKYLIGNQTIDSSHIIRVVYFPEDDERSAAHITLSSINALELDHCATNERIILRDKQADAFWDVYSGDAYKVA